MKTKFYSHGKLLLTAEYLILDGAKALAVPTKKGQSLRVSEIEKNRISWKSIDCFGNTWFEQEYEITAAEFLPKKKLATSNKKEICQTLVKILSYLRELQPELFKETGYSLTTELEFPQDWGLGSSSTLINNLATWAKINPYELLANTFGGSGYDLACAKHSNPILFQLQENKNPLVEGVRFAPSFKDELFFVHLNQKQNSREGIEHYRKQDLARKKEWIKKINEITTKTLNTSSILGFENLIETHENILANILGMPTVKERLFKDYPRSLKSLGAWGGDFIIATGKDKEKAYFKEKGFSTVIDFSEMVF
ncbi:GYDIA family GHMP kinase [Mesonia aestuariivivens]|uniref:GHMP kinase n=1 Tax=Mesonia aestuariivivens TaxID=2796128 RepID=A0ABS6VZZ4_9FLAO|nr:GYDIA family GHMP kinase [Mesonia aestuariivivens]MBW2960434.1 GHMP kinase [Mesonia aestuariivivens]